VKAELTTPKAILIGLSLIAVAIASIPYSKSVVSNAHAANGATKVIICDNSGAVCGLGFDSVMYVQDLQPSKRH
jgi:hypothetical protein